MSFSGSGFSGSNTVQPSSTGAQQADSGFQSLPASKHSSRSFLTYPSAEVARSNYTSADGCVSGRGFTMESPFGSASDHEFPTAGQSVNNFNSTADAGEFNCNCGDVAVLRTVRKEGPNTGDKFVFLSG